MNDPPRQEPNGSPLGDEAGNETDERAEASAEAAAPDEGADKTSDSAPETSDATPIIEDVARPRETLDFPIVGVGASAGGLGAFEELLAHLPADAGLAVVFVQHLSPQHESSLVDILPRKTKMPVHEAGDGVPIERNHVYVIPPNRDLAVMHGALHLMTRPQSPARHMPIDYLFRSLAEDQGRRAIGVVLSGTGSDGAAGLRAIKAQGGVTLAQDEQSARYSGMPHAAAATGQVDLVLPPDEIAKELVRIIKHPQVARPADRREGRAALGSARALQKIFVVLRQATGVDFSQYKQSTVERRIARRMVLHKIDSLEKYLQYLQKTPGEVHLLFDDMLISVTAFFREPETFDALKERVFPQIVQEKGPDTPIRIWVPGCSTGEEPYSIAIALLEYLAEREMHLPAQIFATDISQSSIERARHGHYADNIAGDVSEQRLKRYFVRSGDGYQISKTVRDLCVFARQNVVKDPPFSNLDLVSCRNLLIYLGPALQKRVVPTFHYALRPTGYLLLGSSETIGSFADLFTLVHREQKIYAKKQAATRLPPDLGPRETAGPPEVERAVEPAGRTEGCDLEREANELLLDRYAPPGVIVTHEMNILHFRGHTGRFLEPAPGTASLNLLKMARPGLALDLRTAIHEARKQHRPTRKEGLRTTTNGGAITVNLEVHPLGRPHSDDLHFLILFHEVFPPTAPPPEEKQKAETVEPSAPAEELQQELERVEQELRQTKATMQTIVEEHEATNEELRAANEEIQSANEELQSTNEELETAKEELQSTNEELTTLNAELENQNAEANRAIDDFNNLHRAVDIPVVLLENDLRIRTFTPPAQRQLGLQPSDQGRRIRDLKLGLRVEGLDGKIGEVLQTLNTFRQDVRSEGGGWFSMRIRPYRTADDRITGAVLVLVDVTETRHASEALANAQALAEGVVATVHQPLLVLDGELHVVKANRAFFDTFGVSGGETDGRKVYELGDGQWDHPELRRLLEEIVPENTEFEGVEIVHDFPHIGRKRTLLDARRIEQQGDRPYLILLTVRELSDA